MTYTSILLLSLAGYSLVLAWICLMGERAAAAKEVRELKRYIQALEQGVDELHARVRLCRAEVENLLGDQDAGCGLCRTDDGVSLRHSFPCSCACHDRFEVTACPSCGSETRSGRCFIPTGIGHQHVLCQSLWHRD